MNPETKGYDPRQEAVDRLEKLNANRGTLMEVIHYCEGGK